MISMQNVHKQGRSIPILRQFHRQGFQPKYGETGFDIDCMAETIEAINHLIDTGIDPLELSEQSYTDLLGRCPEFFSVLEKNTKNAELYDSFSGEEHSAVLIEGCTLMNYLAEGVYRDEPGRYPAIEQYTKIIFYFRNVPVSRTSTRLILTRIVFNNVDELKTLR